ncbi:MAG: carboxypeptidase regulatory-like domain-containing protein [Deltaproteobacteria bacterium]|nr:MAG: carboxypeptidase regulatory-like domain-containing protein [Deltaproteobacteria bacterium]
MACSGLRCGILVAALLAPSACRSGRAEVVVPTQPSAGRSPLCPDRPVGLDASPDLRRCSYDDAVGQGATKLSGRVVVDGAPGGIGEGIADLAITIHRVDDPTRAAGHGPRVARARTDAQGRFSLAVVLPPGSYDVVARQDLEGAALAVRRIVVTGKGVREISDVMLAIPAPTPPEPMAPTGEPSEPSPKGEGASDPPPPRIDAG